MVGQGATARVVRCSLVSISLLSLSAAGCSDETIGVAAPAIRVSPQAIDLGATSIGVIAKHAVTITSAGSSPLEVKSVVLVASGTSSIATDLALSLPETLPKTIAINQTFVFELQHLPSDAVLDTGKIIITSNDPNRASIEVPINHVAVGAPEIAAVPDTDAAEVEAGTPGGLRTFVASVRFGQVPVGTRRVETFFLVNGGAGNVPLSVANIALRDVVADLVVTADPVVTRPVLVAPLVVGGVRPTGTRWIEVSISWSPQAGGTTLDTVLEVSSNDPAQTTLEIPISGSTEMVAGPLLRVEPAMINFGAVNVGASGMQQVRIFNDGGSSLDLQPLQILNNPNNVFALVQAPTMISIPAGGMRSFDLRYTPQAAQSDTAMLHVIATGLTPVDIPLSGSGTVMMACMPAMPDPQEPMNGACASAIDRGAINLGINQTETRNWMGPMIELASDEDWSRFTLDVDSGCDFVGYDVSVRATISSGEQAEVCVYLGACGAPDFSDCSTGGGMARVFAFPGDTMCNSFGNAVPAYVQIRHTSGTPMCQPYSVTFSAR